MEFFEQCAKKKKFKKNKNKKNFEKKKKKKILKKFKKKSKKKFIFQNSCEIQSTLISKKYKSPKKS